MEVPKTSVGNKNLVDSEITGKLQRVAWSGDNRCWRKFCLWGKLFQTLMSKLLIVFKKENCLELTGRYDTIKKSENNCTQEEPVQICSDTRDHICFFSKFPLLEQRIASSPSQPDNDGMKSCNFSYYSHNQCFYWEFELLKVSSLLITLHIALKAYKNSQNSKPKFLAWFFKAFCALLNLKVMSINLAISKRSILLQQVHLEL